MKKKMLLMRKKRRSNWLLKLVRRPLRMQKRTNARRPRSKVLTKNSRKDKRNSESFNLKPRSRMVLV